MGQLEELEQPAERQIMSHRDLGKTPDGKYLTSEFTFSDDSILTVDFRLQKTHKGSRQMKARYQNDIRALVAYGMPSNALDKFIVAREMVERRAAAGLTIIPAEKEEVIDEDAAA